MRAAGTSHILGLYGIPSGQDSWSLKKQTWERAASSGAAMQRENQNAVRDERVPPSQSLLGMVCIAGKTSPKS